MDNLDDKFQEFLNGPTPETKQEVGKKALERSPGIRGNLARAMMPKLEKNPEQQTEEAFQKFLEGGKTAEPDFQQSRSLASQALASNPSTKEDEAFKSFLTGKNFKVGVQKTSVGDRILEVLGSETAQKFFTALSIDEHLMVKGMSKAFGDSEKKNLGDYTWTTFLQDRGMEDNAYTTAMGVSMSIFLSPS